MQLFSYSLPDIFSWFSVLQINYKTFQPLKLNWNVQMFPAGQRDCRLFNLSCLETHATLKTYVASSISELWGHRQVDNLSADPNERTIKLCFFFRKRLSDLHASLLQITSHTKHNQKINEKNTMIQLLISKLYSWNKLHLEQILTFKMISCKPISKSYPISYHCVVYSDST